MVCPVLPLITIFLICVVNRSPNPWTIRFTRVFWLDGTNKATIEQSYKAIGSQIHESAGERIEAGAARALLDSLDEQWLLLVDGLDEAEAMSGLWPQGRFGNVIYTSRNPVLKDFPRHAVCSVAELEEADAVDLLLDAARLNPASEEVSQLARDAVSELGWLALAVDQAGAYIARGECRIHDFVDVFKKHRAKLLAVDSYKGASSYERAVYATWDLSYKAIERGAMARARQSPEAVVAQNALQLLNMLAYFHYENVTDEIFRRAAEDEWRGDQYPREVDPEGELAYGVNLPENLLPLDGKGQVGCPPFSPST